ncbi:MAG: pyrroline-5-carboxylate reductase [Treponema sp.]|nr:pyrroline-5-carboxylate reductase [Treponema sp.]
MKSIGFIGMGNMAQALCSGFVKSGKISGNNIYAYAPNQEKLEANSRKFGFVPCRSLHDATVNADVIVFACKPYQIEDVLKEIKNDLKGKAVISIALGWNYKKFSEVLDKSTRFQFVMPNTPAMVGEGVFLFEKTNSLEKAERDEFIEIFESMGVVQELGDNLMGIGGALTGCGPAFIDVFMEAYADAAVKYGIQRKDAYRLFSQTVLGTAKLQLETGLHPGILKDNVCSPGGSTIRGVGALEEFGLRNACIKSIDAVMGY